MIIVVCYQYKFYLIISCSCGRQFLQVIQCLQCNFIIIIIIIIYFYY